MPFLAALMGERWDGRWAGYAYMITMELYSASATSDLGAGGYYFRLYYNGEILTLPGCSTQLCDVNILLNALSFGQEYMPCTVSEDTVETDDDDEDQCADHLSTANWIVITAMTFLLGGLIGAALVVFIDRRRKFMNLDVVARTTSTHPLHNNI